MINVPATALSSDEVRKHILARNKEELAIIDVRKSGCFSRGHLLWATSIPFGDLETKTADLLPRYSVPIILCSEDLKDESLVCRSAEKLCEFGYSNLFYLRGGVKSWKESGFEVFSGVNVPSKAFGEFIEKVHKTPSIGPQNLKKMMDNGKDFLILDSRPTDEYQNMSIPSGINCPGAELVLRIHDLAPDPGTPVIVNCAGRTRSIIGCQSLKNAQIPNPVFALENGTMGWHLAGFGLESGARQFYGEVSAEGYRKAQEAVVKIAKQYGITKVDWETVKKWKGEENRSTFLLDVRQPKEFESGHIKTSISAPGGQLIQATDQYIGILGARVILVDDLDVRAIMTATWLRQMGWHDVFVLDRTSYKELEIQGKHSPKTHGLDSASCKFIDARKLKVLLEKKSVSLVDLAISSKYIAGHIPSAHYATREGLPEKLNFFQKQSEVVLTSPSGQQALLASSDLRKMGVETKVLSGGTKAWEACGFEIETGLTRCFEEPADIWQPPYELEGDPDFAMREYLSWEIRLVEQIRLDGTTDFQIFPEV